MLTSSLWWECLAVHRALTSPLGKRGHSERKAWALCSWGRREKNWCINYKPQLSSCMKHHRSHLTPTSDSPNINPNLGGRKQIPRHSESAKPKAGSLGKFPDLPSWKIISSQKIKGFTALGNRNRRKKLRGKNASGEWWKESLWEWMSY